MKYGTSDHSPWYTEKTLYKRDSTGNIRSWWIGVTNNGSSADIIVRSGLTDGKKVEQVTNISEGKNIGRANETSYLEQAVSEANSKIASQIKDGYVESIKDLQDSGIKGSGSYQVMLAKTYDPEKKQSGSKDLSGYKLLGKQIGVQRKYDGVRRLSKIDENGVVMYTRSGDVSDTLPHIEEALFEAYKRVGFSGTVWVDGEAYSHKISFNTVNGITRKGIKTAKDHHDRSLIEYHMYDFFIDGDQDDSYMNRHVNLQHLVGGPLIHVETHIIIADADELKRLHDQYVSEGYEGLMIRNLEGGYDHKRSQSLLKYKSFEDAEFFAIDVLPSVEGDKDKAGKIVFKMDRIAYDAAGKLIETFKATPVGPDEEMRNLLKCKDQVIGRMHTVNFFGRSEYGVPRFPRAKGLKLNQ